MDPINELRGRMRDVEKTNVLHGEKLHRMDEWQRNADVAFARRDEQFLGVKEDLGRIMGTLSRIVWLIITAIVIAVMAFLIKGGFQVP
jgi:hypothetical protein